MATNVVHLLKLVFLLFFSCLWTRHAAEWIYVTPAQAYNSSVGDTLKPGDTLNSSSFLVSAKGTFALGFFRRIDSTSNESYVGISDMADPSMAFNLYVWFGNRGNPIVKHSGMLTLDNNGTLKIVLQGEDPIVIYTSPTINTVGTLLDTGNFVLKEVDLNGSMKRVLWQSFDYPVDTLLPGMRLGVNHKTGHTWSMRSFLTTDIPDQGSFALEWDPKGLELIFKQRGGKDRIHSIHMRKANAKCLMANMIKLDSKNAADTFVHTFHEGDTAFIVQRCSNHKGHYISMQETYKGGRRGPEGSSETNKQRHSHASTKLSNIAGPSNGGASFAEVAVGASHDSGDPHLSIQSGVDLAVGIEPESALIPISSNPEPRVEIRALFCEAMASMCIDRTWGSSSEWMLELRDGRQEEREEDDVTMVWEDVVPSDVGKELVCWGTKEEPLVMALLAMVEPDGDIMGASTAPKLGDCNEPQPNLRKKAMKSGVKGSRELKNLVSSINYEGRGLNDKDKSLRVCHLLNLWGADVIFLQETKLDLVTRSLGGRETGGCSGQLLGFMSGGHRLSTTMQGFLDFITALGLIDPQLKGGTFTRTNNRDVEARSCIDRFLFSPNWEDHFPSIIQRCMPRLMSNHFPILLVCGQLQKCRCLFRFQKIWFKADEFVDRVRQSWLSYQFYGSPSYILANKLKAFKANLKKWNTESFDEVGWRPKLDRLSFPLLSDDDVGWLVRPFDEEEVVGVIKGFNGDKAPGADGFPMAFFQHQLEYLRAMFSWFEAVSGLKINLSKSEMVLVGNVPHIGDLVEILGCKVSALPMTYLGLPLGARFNSVSIWDLILEKMERRLAGWKQLYLSKGGKWLWHYGTDREALWREIVEAKYGGMWGGWCSDIGRGSYRKVRFWHDVWHGDRSLRVVYLELFSIIEDRDTTVADLMSNRNGVLHWELTFSRNVHDWEKDSMNSLRN
uniref:Bulb-type lectin domain-containing protein n=1 Tax=Fagus sylvatica TaxID=28930 RepID=A0A2N9GI04_FAGSY